MTLKPAGHFGEAQGKPVRKISLSSLKLPRMQLIKHTPHPCESIVESLRLDVAAGATDTSRAMLLKFTAQ